MPEIKHPTPQQVVQLCIEHGDRLKSLEAGQETIRAESKAGRAALGEEVRRIEAELRADMRAGFASVVTALERRVALIDRLLRPQVLWALVAMVLAFGAVLGSVSVAEVPWPWAAQARAGDGASDVVVDSGPILDP